MTDFLILLTILYNVMHQSSFWLLQNNQNLKVMSERFIAQGQGGQDESQGLLSELVNRENEVLSHQFLSKVEQPPQIDSEEDSPQSEEDKQEPMLSELDDRQLQLQVEESNNQNPTNYHKHPVNYPVDSASFTILEKFKQDPYFIEKPSQFKDSNFKQPKYLQAGEQSNQKQSNLCEQPMPRYQQQRKLSHEQAKQKIMERHEKMLRLTSQSFDRSYKLNRQYQLLLQRQQKNARQRQKAFDQNKKKMEEMAKKKEAEREMGFFQVVKNWFVGKKQDQSQPQ